MRHLQEHKRLVAIGEALGREGMSLRVIEAVADFEKQKKTYKGAIHLAGRLKAIAAMTKADEYWHEKMNAGFQAELRKPLPAPPLSRNAPDTD